MTDMRGLGALVGLTEDALTGEDSEPNPDDVGDMQLPGPEDGSVLTPRDVPEPTNDGDLDVGESADPSVRDDDEADLDVPAGVHDGEG